MTRIALLLGTLLLSLPAHAVTSGEKAPGWELNDLRGETHRLEEWRGQWVLLKMGTTRCPNCAREIRELEKIGDPLEDLGVRVLDIYLREDRYRVKRYLRKHPSDLGREVLYDWKGGLVRSYGISIIPHLFLVDPEGTVRWQARYTPAETLLDAVRREVRGRTAGSP